MKTIDPRPILLFCVSFLTGICSGCMSVDLQKPYPNVTTYVLETVRPSGPAGRLNMQPVAIQVDSFSAVPGTTDIFFSYRTGETIFESDFYNQTLVAPALLVTERIREWMKQVPYVKFVLDEDAAVESFYVVDGKLLGFYGDYRDESNPLAVLSLECMVTSFGDGKNNLLMQKTYEQKVPMNSISPKELAHGWDQGLGNVLKAFESDLATLITKSGT